MRFLLKSFILFLLTLSFWACKTEQQQEDNRPNIIFILTDDQRWDALGYAGNKHISTPEMDKLAADGYYFKNALVTTPICAASRASILSGLHERTHQYNFHSKPISEKIAKHSYPYLLRKAGYKTGFYGKLGVHIENVESLFDVNEFYDRLSSEKNYKGYFYKTLGDDTVHLTRYTGQKAIEFIANSEGGEPFCLSLSFSAPHAHDPASDQYFWQAETDSLYKSQNMPGPSLGDDFYYDSLPEAVRKGINRVRWNWRFNTSEKYQHSVKGYYRMISGIDRELGKIREALMEKGIAKNTVIIVMGDNGYFLGERQLAGKWLMYDNSLRVPLIIYDPRDKKHQNIEEMALNIDVTPTLLTLAGVESPKSFQGKSLVTSDGRISVFERDTVLVEHLYKHPNIPPSEGIRTHHWKYFRYILDRSTEELYDLENDPGETINLAKNQQYTDTLNELRKACDRKINAFSAN